MDRSIQDSPETQAILRRMEEVRCDLDEGAQEIAEGARDMGEWLHYVKNYPWISMGVACIIGYVIVPRRRLKVRKINQTLDDHSQQLKQAQTPSTSGVRSAVLMFVGSLLWRSTLSYIMRQATQHFETQSASSPPEDQP